MVMLRPFAVLITALVLIMDFRIHPHLKLNQQIISLDLESRRRVSASPTLPLISHLLPLAGLSPHLSVHLSVSVLRPHV